jgi:hypothetical protein
MSILKQYKPASPYTAGGRPAWLPVLGIVLLAHLVILLGWACRRPQRPEQTQEPAPDDGETVAVATNAVPERTMPERFPRNTYMPNIREGEASGSIHMPTFSPGRDLIYIDDPRAWWESDHDGEYDDECDHSIHKNLEAPLRRVIEAVAARGATLKVQDAYRPTGIHNKRSLHREGRAVDLTCDGLELEELAKICWVAGFDWVYHECPKGGGDHIHASVRR